MATRERMLSIDRILTQYRPLLRQHGGLVLRILFIIILIIDCFINNQQGFKFPKKIIYGFNYTTHGPIDEPCSYDYEGSWAIGRTTKLSSPLDLSNDYINTKQPMVSCALLGHDQPASFVADPFLYRNTESNEWYLFFEYKNLHRFIGELGVAKSVDQGKSWTYVGTALSEPFHLSYPFVFPNKNGDGYLMIPETNQAKEVRVYHTSSDNFPLGWTKVATPLSGKHFVDTSIVWFHNTYYIFTSARDGLGLGRAASLYLYTTKDLINKPWVEHPSSPIVRGSTSLGRPGGRPFVYKNHIYRFGQDGTHFYGQALYMIRVSELTGTTYQEEIVQTLTPNVDNYWTKHRFHHVDMQRIDDDHWFAIFDADEHTDYDEFMKHEHRFYYFKKVVLAIFIGIVGSELVVLLHKKRISKEKSYEVVSLNDS